MGDFRAGGCSNQRGHASIAEEVQHLDRALRSFYFLAHPVPMNLLLGEDADMAEAGEAAVEIDVEKLHGPGFAERTLWEAPAAHAVFVRVAGEDGIDMVPMFCGKRTLPERLSLGTHDP